MAARPTPADRPRAARPAAARVRRRSAAGRDRGGRHARRRPHRAAARPGPRRCATAGSSGSATTSRVGHRRARRRTTAPGASRAAPTSPSTRRSGWPASAVEVARASRPLNAEPVELADEPVYGDVTWVSAYDVDPFAVDPAEKVALFARLVAAAAGLRRRRPRRRQPAAGARGQVLRRQRRHDDDPAAGARAAAADRDARRPGRRLRDDAHPRAAGRPRLGVPRRRPLRLGRRARAAARAAARRRPRRSSVEPGRYDLVIDPSNLWLTIHESIGHATELDRALGYEAAYAGTSFATLDQLGTLQYGSPVMQVTGDRTTPHGLATIGWDDEGVQTQEWDIVRDGVLVGYQLDRRMARQNAAALGSRRSNGCAFADSPSHVPVQRMANVSLQPGAGRPVDRGAHRPGRPRHLRRRRQELVDRHAALQLPVHRPALLRDPRRPARRAAARRGLPGDDDRLLGLARGGGRSADLPARRRLQLRQGAAESDRGGVARLPHRRCSARVQVLNTAREGGR